MGTEVPQFCRVLVANPSNSIDDVQSPQKGLSFIEFVVLHDPKGLLSLSAFSTMGLSQWHNGNPKHINPRLYIIETEPFVVHDSAFAHFAPSHLTVNFSGLSSFLAPL